MSIPSRVVTRRAHVKIELDEGKLPAKRKISPQKTKPQKIKPAKTLKIEKSEYFDPQPLNWEELYENIREMRLKQDAPVDSMGCQKCYSESATEAERRFQILMALLMSSQTKDEINSAAMIRLNERFESFSASKAAAADETELGQIIKPVGFYKTKAKNIIKVGKICNETYSGDIPDTIEGLTALPGIGPKMGYLTLQCAWGKSHGIGVDVHVHRICQRLKWTKAPKNPEATRAQLEAWLPKDRWSEVNSMLVGFGQQICSARAPKCGECLNNTLCPKYFGGEKKKK